MAAKGYTGFYGPRIWLWGKPVDYRFARWINCWELLGRMHAVLWVYGIGPKETDTACLHRAWRSFHATARAEPWGMPQAHPWRPHHIFWPTGPPPWAPKGPLGFGVSYDISGAKRFVRALKGWRL